MLVCPNVNDPSWKALEKAVGRFEAFKDFMQHDGDIRTPEEVLSKLEADKPMELRYSKPDIGDVTTLKQEAAESLMEFLERKFPDLKGKIINDKKKVWKGRLEGKTPIINLAYAEMSDGFHEFSHPFLMALRKSNSKTFNALFDNLMEAPEWDEIKKKAVSRVERLYPELKKGSVMLFKEEIMATAIGYAAELKATDSQKTISEKLGKVIGDLFKWLNEFFNEFLSVFTNTNELTPTTTFADVIDMLTDNHTQILLDENWDKLVESSIAADQMLGVLTTNHDAIATKLENDMQAAIIVNKAFDINEFTEMWLNKNFKLPVRPYKPRKEKPDETIRQLALNMLYSSSVRGFQLHAKQYKQIEPATPAETEDSNDPFSNLPSLWKPNNKVLDKLIEVLTPMELNFKFASYLNSKGSVPVSMNQPFVTIKHIDSVDKNNQPFVQTKISIPMSLSEAEVVNDFQEVMKTKFPNRKSIPSNELASEYMTWANDNYGINWTEATGHVGYGMKNFMTPGGKLDHYTRILFMDDTYNQSGHSFKINDTDVTGNGLGWYVTAIINGNRFDHEFQSDVLPEVNRDFEKGLYDSVGSTRRKDVSRTDKVKELAANKLAKMITGTADRIFIRTRIWDKIKSLDNDTVSPPLNLPTQNLLNEGDIEDLELPFSKIDNIDPVELQNIQQHLQSELNVEISALKHGNISSRLNNLPHFKVGSKIFNLFLGRKSPQQTELFNWIKTFDIVPHVPEISTPGTGSFDELPFSKTEGEDPYRKKILTKYNKEGQPILDIYLTAESIRTAPAFIAKIVKVNNEWIDSGAPIKPTQKLYEADMIERAARAASELLDRDGVIRKNFGANKKFIQQSRNIQRQELDKIFNSYKFSMSSLKGFEWRQQVYKNPNNILRIADHYKGQFQRLYKFYEGLFDQAQAEAASKETKEGDRDPQYTRYKKYNDLYYKWFEIVVHQSINSAKAEGRNHYYLPTAKAMNKIEGNSAAEKVYWSPADNENAKFTGIYETTPDLIGSVAQYISQNTPETAREIAPYLTPDVREQFGITQNSTAMDVAEALLFGGTNFHTNRNFAEWKLSQGAAQGPALPTKPNGPFYNAMTSIAKKNNIKLTFEKPEWSSETLIKVDLTNYTPKPVDRFSKVDKKPQPMKEQPSGNLAKFKKEISLSGKQVSWSKRAAVNSKVKGANGKLGTSYYVKFTQVGQADLYTWEILDYAQPTNDDAADVVKFFKETGSLVELALEERERIPLDTTTNNNTQAIEALNNMAQALSNQLGIDYQFITPEQAAEITKGSKNPWTNEPCFFVGKIVYFVGNNLRPDMVLHEFSHPLIRSIAVNNNKLFNALYAKLESTPEGQAIIAEVMDKYKDELTPGSDSFKEECLVRGLVAAADIKVPLKAVTPFVQAIKDLLAAIKQLLRKVFGQKVDVAKLNENTSLKDIADMLTKGGNFKIETDALNDKDIVAYLKDTREAIDDIMKISKPELMALTTRVYDIASKHIDIVMNNKNYEEMLHVLADEYDRGDLQEIRKNLSKYANKLSNRMKEVKDEVEFNRNHAAAMVNTLFRLEGMVEKIHTHMEDLATDPDNVNNLHKAFYYNSLLKYWEGFVAEVKEALDQQKIPSSSPMSQIINNIDRTLEKSKVLTQSMSAEGIKDILFQELMPIAKTVDKRYQDIIADLKKRKASQNVIDKWTKEYLGLTEEESKRLDVLEAANKEGRLTSELKKEYERLKLQSFEGAKLTPDKLDRALKGELGDANAFNSFFEGYLYNTDPIVGGFALYVKNHMNDVLVTAQAKYNDYAQDMAPLLKAAGYNPSNVSELASKITQVQKVGSKDKDGNLVEKEVLSFMSPHHNYRLVLDQHRHAIDAAEKNYSLTGTKEDETTMINAISALKKLNRDYFHQEYVSDYYKLEDILERDDIGKRAAYLRDNIFERMRGITQPLETQMDEINVSDKVDALWSEYRQLNSLYDLSGKKKTNSFVDNEGKTVVTNDLAIAERLREYKDAARDFHEWKERKGVFQNSLLAYEQELVNAKYAADSTIFKELRDQWIYKNTKVVVKPSFYEKRGAILDRIAEIMSRVPDAARKDIDIGPLYQEIIGIAYTFRDDDNQPNGQSMSPKSIAEVKELQEKILKAQKAFAKLNGLTEAESEEMSSYFTTIKKGERRLTIEENDRLNELMSKKKSGLPNLTKIELYKLFADLDVMQRKEATEYYVDIMNNWLDKLDTTKLHDRNKVGYINKVNANMVLEPHIIEDLLSQSDAFSKWFHANHISKSKWNPVSKTKEQYWERVYVWNVVRPTDPADYESTNLTDKEGNVTETIQGVPTTKYFVRRVKNEHRTKRVAGDTVDNRGNWLPRMDVKDSPYINQDYFKLKKENPKLFAVLEMMSKHHLQNQEGLGYKSRLYLDVPRFRKNALEVVQTQQLQRTLKGAVAGRLPLLTLLVQRLKLFWQRAKDPQEQGLNPNVGNEDFMLVRADMFDNEVSSVPIAGLYDIPVNDVSTDLTHSMMRYMLSAERQKKLIEINPVARALQNVVNDDKNQVKRLDAVNRFNFINRGVVTYLNKKGFNTRKSAVNNFIEREFEGQGNTGMLSDVPWINNTASLIFKRASFGFFALNIPSALKNTLGAKFQGMIEAAGGKYMNLKNFTKGEGWAFNTMGQISFEIYKKGPKSLNIQLVEVFDALQGKFEEKFGESMSRTLASDTANLSWLYNFRKWTESQATLQAFAGMMHHQKVKQGDTEIDYINAWEVRDGKIQLKAGVDPEWGITYDKEGNIKIGSEFKMMKNRIQQVINSLNGAYASFDQPEAQRYLAFRFVSFLRRYFTAMAVNRWGFSGGFGKARGRMNPGLGDINEGYYITVMKTLSRMVTTDSKYLAYMTPDEKKAWLKTSVELFALLAISMLAVPMLGWDEDDKEKYEKLRARSGSMPFLGLAPEDEDHPFDGYGFLENHLLSLAMQVRSENEQFVPWPNFGLDDYTSMLDLKSLATGPTLKAYKQMFTVGLDQVTGDPSAYYKRSIGAYEWQQEGGSKFLNYFFKAFGLTGSSIDPVTAIKNSQGIIIRGK